MAISETNGQGVESYPYPVKEGQRYDRGQILVNTIYLHCVNLSVAVETLLLLIQLLLLNIQ